VRSNLRAAEACGSEGDERECRDGCGMGIQTCERGFWQPCQVPPRERGCRNDCGEGSQRCENARWGPCEVEPVVETCEDDCGQGERTCQNNAWGECQVEPASRECATACGTGREWCEQGSWGACDAPQPRPPKLNTVVRDFLEVHGDFEREAPGRAGGDPGAVEELLDAEDKPVLAVPSTWSITSPESFAEWYRDVPGVNQPLRVELQLEESRAGNALFEYRDNAFFPIDDQGFGNEGRLHNYHFTLEAATEFRYVGGEVFIFTGDDDLWVFVNRRLAIDLGGLHTSLRGEVALDDIRVSHGLEIGEVYPLHIFFAERHTVSSNFTIETSIAGPPECD